MFNSDTSTPVGSSKAFNVKIKSATSLPECLDTCSADGQPKASDVKAGYCYIDRHCYKTGDFSPYPGADCMHFATTPLTWDRVSLLTWDRVSLLERARWSGAAPTRPPTASSAASALVTASTSKSAADGRWWMTRA